MSFFNKKIYLFLFIVFLATTFFILKQSKSFAYPVQYGGRIIHSVPPAVCSNPYACQGACVLCGCGSWFQVAIQPSGGSGFYFCPSFTATKGSNPMYLAGGSVITGGTSPYSLDPNNTASVVKEDKIESKRMLVWFKIKNFFHENQ